MSGRLVLPCSAAANKHGRMTYRSDGRNAAGRIILHLTWMGPRSAYRTGEFTIALPAEDPDRPQHPTTAKISAIPGGSDRFVMYGSVVYLRRRCFGFVRAETVSSTPSPSILTTRLDQRGPSAGRRGGSRKIIARLHALTDARRLNLAEFDPRLRQACVTRTYPELLPILSDLPDVDDRSNIGNADGPPGRYREVSPPTGRSPCRGLVVSPCGT